MATSAPLSYAEDPTLYLYTSLTAGSSHIITATSRLETILKANKIAFRAIDTATDEKARMIWGRRSRGRKLPGLVKYAQVVGDLEQIEEWNEYGELKENIDDTPAAESTPTKPVAPSASLSGPPSRDTSETRHISIFEPPKSADRNSIAVMDQTESPMAMAMRQAGAEAAAKAGQKKTIKPMPAAPEPAEHETTAPVVEPIIASPMADPSSEPQTTQGKAPNQLAVEGAKRTSVDKIAETVKGADASGTVGGALETPTSTEQQVADLRRSSSIAKAPSRLAETQTQEEIPEETSDVKEETSDVKEETSEVEEKAPEAKEELREEPGGSPRFEPRPQTHRGSSLSQASKEEIREMEKRNSIAEEPMEDDEEVL